MKKQVTSLKTSKKLKELGVEQSAYWSWYTNADNAELIHNPDGYRSMEAKTFDAFTASELAEMLPKYIHKGENKYYFLSVSTSGESWEATYNWHDANLIHVENVSLVEALAEALIRLKNDETLNLKNMTTDLSAELDKIYDSEINVEISSFWDAGFTIRIGDECNGYLGSSSCLSVAELVPNLRSLICELLPNSDYAKNLTNKNG